MKAPFCVLFILYAAIFASGHSAEQLEFQNVRSVADMKLEKKGTCGSDTLESEAKCSCYHASTKESMPGPLEDVCKESFGNDLSALKGSCAPYMKNGDLDEGLGESLKKTIDSCEGELPSDGEGTSRMVMKDTARFWPGLPAFCIGPWWGWTLGWPWGWRRFYGWWYWWWIIRYHYYWYWRCVIFNILSGGLGGVFFGAASPSA